MVSFKKEDQVKGGKLPPSGRYLCKSWRFVSWDYNGKRKPDTFLCITISYKGDDEDLRKEYKDHPCYYGVGRGAVVVKDGLNIEYKTKAKGLPDNCNTALLFGSMWATKTNPMPDDMPEDDISVLDGIELEFERVDQPKREMSKKKGGITGGDEEEDEEEEKEKDEDRKDTFLMVTKIYKAPWVKGKAADEEEAPVKKKAAASDDDEAPAPAKGDDAKALRKQAIAAIKSVMEDNPKGITKKALGKEVFALVKKEANAAEVVEWVYDDDNLGAIPGYDYDAKAAKLVPEA